MRTFLGLLLALTCSTLFADEKAPEVDAAEVMRRGDMVIVAGEGPRSDATEAFLTAMAPPADDSHKWFVTVLTMKDCPACETLKKDFRNAPELLSFVTAPDEAKAWAHYNEFSINDATQKWRVKEYKATGFPTLVIQPPRNGMWGDPRTVVYQTSGYDGKSQKLADLIRDGVRKYSAKMAEQGYPKMAPRSASTAEANSFAASVIGGARQQEVGVDPPFETPARPDPFNPQYNPSPSPAPSQWPPPAQPQQPAVTPSPDGGFLPRVMQTLTALGIGLLVILRVLERVAPVTPTKTDDIALVVLKQVVSLMQQAGIIQPTPVAPVVPVTPVVPIQQFQPGPAVKAP
jgi:thioredoxin-related protein